MLKPIEGNILIGLIILVIGYLLFFGTLIWIEHWDSFYTKKYGTHIYKDRFGYESAITNCNSKEHDKMNKGYFFSWIGIFLIILGLYYMCQ